LVEDANNNGKTLVGEKRNTEKEKEMLRRVK